MLCESVFSSKSKGAGRKLLRVAFLTLALGAVWPDTGAAGSKGQFGKVDPGVFQQVDPGVVGSSYLFKFSVPVQLAKLHSAVEKAVVWCVAGSTEGLTVQGTGVTDIPLTNGGYSGGNVTVLITKMEQGDPSMVDAWVCQIAFQIGGEAHEPLSKECTAADLKPSAPIDGGLVQVATPADKLGSKGIALCPQSTATVRTAGKY